MSKNLLETFHQQEAETIALSMKLNRWSQVMIRVMITEQEEKLLASDLPVDDVEPTDNFWEEIA